MEPLTVPPLDLDFSERLTPVTLLAARNRPDRWANAETLLLNWCDGYWHEALCELLYESEFTATLGLDLEDMDELDVGDHPKDAMAVWHVADLLTYYVDYAGDLDQEAFQLVLRAITGIRDGERDDFSEYDDEHADHADVGDMPQCGGGMARSWELYSPPASAQLRALGLRMESMEALADELTADPKPESRSGRTWSQEEIERMVSLYQDGETVTVIARTLGRRESAVKNRIASVLDLIRRDDAFLVDGRPSFPHLDVPRGYYREDEDEFI